MNNQELTDVQTKLINEINEKSNHLFAVLNRPAPALWIPEPTKEYMELYNKALEDVETARVSLVKVIACYE